MAKSTDVILIAGTISEHETSASVWARIPRLTNIGSIGEQSESKEKTTLEHTIRKYDSGLRDAPDKNLSGQYIPFQESGDKYYDDYVLQQDFIARCKAEEEFNVRVTFPDGDRMGWEHKALGFQIDEGTQEDWKMFTSNGKQNTRVIYQSDLSITGEATVSTGSDIELTLDISRSGLDAGDIVWASSDVSLATIVADSTDTTKATLTGVDAGTVTITAEARGVPTTFEVTVS